MGRIFLGVAAACGCTAIAGADVTFNLISQIDLTITQDPLGGSYIGSNPSTVAWDGTDLYVAGWNNGRGDGDTNAIVRVADAATSPDIQSPFGAYATPNFRGYLSVDVRDGQLVAAYEVGGNDPNGLSIWDVAPVTVTDQIWAYETRPVGATWDAGANGGDAVAWAQFGSGRLRVSDSADGTVLYDGTNGPIVFAGGGTLWRGQDVDVNGDIYMRENNRVIAADRVNDNTTENIRVLVEPTAAGQAGQFINALNTSFGDYVMYNDRDGTSTTFGDAINLIDTDGNVINTTWNGIDTTFATSTGWFDFDYDAASGTLAVLDFSNRQVWIFDVVPAPGAMTLLGLFGLAAARRRR
jgi:hypothetical protein